MRRVVWLVALCLLPILALAQDETSTSEYNRFGLVEGFWFPDLTCDLGVGWERIIFDWSQHQPEGPEDWFTLNVDDRWLRAADECNREVVALLKNTPAWATDGTPGVGVPRGLQLPLDDPGNLWANFVRRAVAYYESRGVNHFIIWNEPDIDSETYGYEFEGDLEDYFNLLRVASIVAKQTNPSAVIHLAGTTYWHDVNEGRAPYMTRLVERILQDPDAPQHGYYFDVLSLHIYFRTESVYDIVHEMRQMLDANGLGEKRIWINETNAAPTDDPEWPVVRPVFQLDLQHQAAFLVHSAALGLAGGADRIAAYKLYDQQLPPGGESFGLLNPVNAVPRPAFHAWAMVAQRFDDVIAADFAQTTAVEAVRLHHANLQQTIVLWARTGEGARAYVEATSNKAYRIGLDGTITVLRPEDGLYDISLTPALCEEGQGCYLGGNPVLIVQPDADNSISDATDDELIPLVFEQE